MAHAQLKATPGSPLRGHVRAPGDKSISHRALILGAMAIGRSEIKGLLEGDDVLRTAAAMRAFGAEVERVGEGAWRITGAGGFSEPEDVVDCGNAGTGVRLIMGAAAGFDLAATFTGDASLRRRPMSRVLDPLTQMGACFLGHGGGRLPQSLRRRPGWDFLHPADGFGSGEVGGSAGRAERHRAGGGARARADPRPH
jgi:3-phosphoshikimate 1-carboxyvinyltransferase